MGYDISAKMYAYWKLASEQVWHFTSENKMFIWKFFTRKKINIKFNYVIKIYKYRENNFLYKCVCTSLESVFFLKDVIKSLWAFNLTIE